MDIELIKRLGLIESVSRINQINEYSFYGGNNEAGEDAGAPPMGGDPMGGAGAPPMGDPMGGAGAPPMGGDPMGGAGAPPMGDPMGGAGAPPMGGDPMGGAGAPPMGDPMGGAGAPPMGGDPMGGPGMPPPPGGDPMGGDKKDKDGKDKDNKDKNDLQPGDDVIDIDKLVQSQDKNNDRITGVSHKLSNLSKALDKFMDAIEQNNRKIEDLEAELERRNPTDKERMNIRSLAGQPYDENPRDFWSKKLKDGANYEIRFDNGISTAKEPTIYTITRGDIDDYNKSEIEDSFDKMHLSDYINF